MKKILLVGGCGFIGHNLALYLKKIGHIPVIVDSLSVNNIYSLDNSEIINQKLYKSILENRISLLKGNSIDLIIQDARNYHSISKLYSEINPEIIIHLAAVSHANRSNKDPHTTFDHSLRTLENALDNAKNNIEHFIFLSSSMVYGNFTKKRVKENDVCEPIGIYGALKFSAEKIIKSYGQVFNLPYTIIRPSALYGERCISRRVGQIFIENVLTKSDIILNGDGTEKLDFTYINDLINGIICVIKSKNSLQETFNITYGNARTINSLVEIIKKNFSKVKIVYKPRDKLMPIRGTLDVSKAKKLLNFESKWSLDRGYPAYIRWYKDLFKK